jgi:hypothetical protein
MLSPQSYRVLSYSLERAEKKDTIICFTLQL